MLRVKIDISASGRSAVVNCAVPQLRGVGLNAAAKPGCPLPLPIAHGTITSVRGGMQRGHNKGADMAAGRCEICGKVTAVGRNIRHRHSGRWERKAPRTSRVFRPNVHKQRVFLNGEARRMNVCTRCLRTVTKAAV